MTKAQALALVTALEGQAVPGSATWTFPAGGGDSWSVAIAPSFVMSGAMLSALADYCTQHALTLSATFDYLGVT